MSRSVFFVVVFFDNVLQSTNKYAERNEALGSGIVIIYVITQPLPRVSFN